MWFVTLFCFPHVCFFDKKSAKPSKYKMGAKHFGIYYTNLKKYMMIKARLAKL